MVAGSLADAAALERLASGAEVVIHLAGLIKAARRRDFFAVNRDGAAAMAEAVARVAPAARFLLVSSLAAREPQLSDYAESKRAGEDAVLARLGERATVLRPAVVYGPGDRETLIFFQLAARRFVPLLGSADSRAAMIHVADLVRLVVAMAKKPRGEAAVCAAADDTRRGYTWEELLGAAARAVGNPAPAFVRAPGPLLVGPGPGRRPGQGVRLEQHGQLAEAARAAASGLGRQLGGTCDRAGLVAALRSRARLRRRGRLVPQGRLDLGAKAPGR